jgi:protein transport protein SEC61 subunit gamma-like protein
MPYTGVEFVKIAQAVGVGFVMMGAIGYTVKLVHIPINNIIVYDIIVTFNQLL